MKDWKLKDLGPWAEWDIPNITRRVKTTLGPRCFLESLETPKGPLSEVLNVLKMCIFSWDWDTPKVKDSQKKQTSMKEPASKDQLCPKLF